MNQADLKIAISRLSQRINNELGGQVACDRLEAELSKLALELERITPNKE